MREQQSWEGTPREGEILEGHCEKVTQWQTPARVDGVRNEHSKGEHSGKKSECKDSKAKCAW